MRRILLILIPALLAPPAQAQLGPNAAEIPIADPEPAAQPEPHADPHPEPARSQNDSGPEPSRSAAVRPAIDELLLSRAREQVATPPSPHSVRQSQQPSPASGPPTSRSLPPTESLPIGQPRAQSALAAADGAEPTMPTLGEGWLQTIIALGGVILLILGLGQLYKRLAGNQGGLVGQLGAGGSAPSGILQVIGRYPISRGLTLVVLKFDRRVLLVAHNSSTRGKLGRGASMQTLCELADPEDVASILLQARDAGGESIAQSFERALQEADDITDQHMHDFEPANAEPGPLRFPARRGEPSRTITTAEGDRAELWSSGQDSRAAAGVLRKRLASMRKGQQG